MNYIRKYHSKLFIACALILVLQGFKQAHAASSCKGRAGLNQVILTLEEPKKENGILSCASVTCPGSGCDIILNNMQPSIPGVVTLINNSQGTALNLQADLVGAGITSSAVTQDSSSCTTLGPGGTCSLYFYPIFSTPLIPSTPVAIQGSNTSAVCFCLAVS